MPLSFLSSLSPTLLVLLSEGVLSLYPILIKTVPTNLFTQWFARFLVFPVLAFAFGSAPKDTPDPYWTAETAVTGLLNLVHIGSSYLSFSLLPTGIALSLFYLYPIFNVLAGSFFFGETLTVQTIAFLLVAFIGVYLVTRRPTETPTEKGHSVTGILAALVAALTETLIYVFVRWSKQASASPFYAIHRLYPMGLVVLLLAWMAKPAALDLTPRTVLSLLGFNAIIGFTGYASRFYAIPKVPTLVFSLLSFIGVLFGYLWGHLFTTEKTQPLAWLGSGLIAFAAFVVRYTHAKDTSG
jgi:drug/metabolite transporter (DMT)-like permease